MLVTGPGDLGYQLALAGATALLGGLVFHRVDAESLPVVGGDTAVLLTGNAWSRADHGWAPQALRIAESRFRRVIVLPASFDANDDVVRETLRASRALFFAGEAESHRQLQELCDVRLAHDSAFFFDYEPWRERTGDGTLAAFRSDADGELGKCTEKGNDDISVTAVDLASFMKRIERAAAVATDRAHVMIAAALMGKQVTFAETPYEALAATAESWLEGFPVAEVKAPRRQQHRRPTEPTEAEQRLRERARATAPPPPDAAPAVTAVILTRDRPALVSTAVSSVLDAGPNVRVLLIGNNPSPAVRPALEALAADDGRVRLELLDEDLGCAGGRVFAAELVEDEYTLFLDDDAEMLDGALTRLLAELENNPEAVGATACVVGPSGGVQHCGGTVIPESDRVVFVLGGADLDFDDPDVPSTGRSDWLPGTAALIRTKILREFPIDPRMRRYYEDNDWSWHVRQSVEKPFRRVCDAYVIHRSTPRRADPDRPHFAQLFERVEFLAAQATFLSKHGLLLDVDLSVTLPELRGGDGRVDGARAKLLLELIAAYGVTWATTEWLGGGFEPIFGEAGVVDALRASIEESQAEVERRGEAIQQLEKHNLELTAGIATRDLEISRLHAENARRDAERLVLVNQYARARREFTDIVERQRAETAEVRRFAREERLRLVAEIDRLWDRVRGAEAELDRIGAMVSWQMLQRTRGKILHTLGGSDSLGGELVQATMRTAGRRLHMLRAEEPSGSQSGDVADELASPVETRRFDPVTVPEYDAPVVSLVMPLYAGAELTHAALTSIVENTLFTPYELIIVDDGQDPDTKSLLSSVHGARVITNDVNIGYLRSVNAGAQFAHGQWLVLCNNDIEVRPGWLDELVACGQSSEDVAVVAPKFLAADGSLAEAGGIVWRDGTGANYGRGDDPNKWRYQYRREVDYGSAAALLVKSAFWRDVGGFDERFLPMYFEDTDLCFEARSRGLKVMYEPRAQVVHHEGATAGTDENEGHKRHQAENRPKFVKKWRELLEAEHLPNPGDAGGHWLGATARHRQHVLLVDHRVPFWDRESGALRALGIINALRDMSYHVSFLPDNLAPIEPYTSELQQLGVEVIYDIETPAEVAEVAEAARLVFVSRPDVASRWWSLLRKHAPEATLVYDTVDLHWIREGREAAIAAGSDQDLLMNASVEWTKALELTLVRVADVTTVVTDREQQLLEEEVPSAVIRVLPNVNPTQPLVPGPDDRDGLLFVGGFEHTPNIAAVLHMVNDVMPLVWEDLPDLVVRVVGPNAPPEIEALASDRVEILGWVPDIAPLLDSSRALLAPLTYGAGLKGKVTQALAAGLPVVTTRVGAEGLGAQDGQGLLIGNTAQELAERVLLVVEDDKLWNRLSREGQQLAEAVCSPSVLWKVLQQLLETEPEPTERPKHPDAMSQ